MGTWGAGAFENDTAADWVYTLERAATVEPVIGALEGASRPGGDADSAARAVAAAEVVAAATGRAAADLPEAVAAWVRAQADQDWESLRERAATVVANVRTHSELAELWEEEGPDEWQRSLDDLAARLKSDA